MQIALTTLLEIGKTLPEETYAKQVVPIITKLFASSDRGIRRGLLENIATFGPALQDKVVEEQVCAWCKEVGVHIGGRAWHV